MSDTNSESAPTWLEVGAEVATLTPSARGEGGTINWLVVAKIGKRDVVLDDGQRFRLDRLERRSGGQWSTMVTYLLPRGDERILKALHANRSSRLFVEIHERWEALRRSKSAVDGRALASSLSEWLAHVDGGAS